jgi:ligand-binding SRPBCC domain-containing protein
LIEEVDWGRRFVDVQLKGPYRVWRHQHDFSDVPDGTLVRDRVDYQLPLGLVGELGGLRFVRRQLDHIFDFRRNTLALLFPREADHSRQ